MGGVKTIQKTLADGLGPHNQFDPSSLDDPIALKTEWTPAKKGGQIFAPTVCRKYQPSAQRLAVCRNLYGGGSGAQKWQTSQCGGSW